MKLKISLVLISMMVLISLVGCTAGDLNQPMYVPDLYPNGNNTGNVGSSTAYFANGYFTNINGAPYFAGGVPALTDSHIFVGSTLNVATDKAVSGDATLINTGALTVTGIQNHGITLPLSVGFLKYDPSGGGSWSFGSSAGGITSVDTGTPSNITGILTGNGSVLGSITDSHTNWDTAYSDRITSATGSGALTLGLSGNTLTGSVDLSSKQNASSILSGLASLSWTSGSPIVRMDGASSFTLDTNTYITGNQSITLGGILSGSGTTTITALAASGYYMPTTTDQSNWNGKMTNPMTTLGDIIYENATPAADRLAGDTSNSDKFLRSLSVAGVAQTPSWQSVTKTDVGLSAVENTALSTWAGTTNITTLGTITTGTWDGSLIAGQYGGTGVANTGKTITLGGNFTTSGAYAATLTLTNTTNVTLPTTGTLLTPATNNGTVTLVASTSITAGQVCYQNSNGDATPAEANSGTTMPAVYIAVAGVGSGNSGTFTTFGVITTGSWTAGQLLYVSDSSAGTIVAVAPSTANDVIEVIGWAISSTQIYFLPNLNMVVHN